MAKKATPAPGIHALLIASDCYLENMLPEGTYPSLLGCVRDVTHVEGFLTGTLKVPANQIRKLTSTNNGNAVPPEPPEDRPTYENILKAFREIGSRAKKGDQVYIHYSGHGGRSITAYPEVKGTDGLDESLVPIDIGNSEARYVRDLELATLLKELTDEGLFVTLVLDCCHSGGATRGGANQVAVRGVNFIDRTKRPAGDVAIAEAVKSAWAKSATMRGLKLQSGLAIEPKGYTLLAACRPSESAYEFAFDGNERNGALTYWMLNAFEQLGPDTTYKDVYDRVLAKVHSQFELQTPMLEGDADRVVLGLKSNPSRPTAIVLDVDPDGKSVTIGGGQATGLRKGAQLAVFARGQTDVSAAAKRKGVVQIETLGATSSGATILPPMPKIGIEAGDQAILLGAGSSKLVRGVRLIKSDGKPAGKADAALQAVAKAMQGNAWVELMTDESQAEFLVTLNEAGSEFEICDRSGTRIENLRPAVMVKSNGAAETVVARLIHLAKYRAVQELDNFDQSSPLHGKLVAELVGSEADYEPGDKPQPKPFPNSKQVPTLVVGETAFLKITNNSGQELNIVALDLESDWSIAQAFPGGQNVFFEPLDAGKSLPLIPLTAVLPAAYEQGTDIIKVFATVGTPNFKVLELPALDKPDVGRSVRTASRGMGGPVDPLDALLGSVAADRPQLRALTAVSSPSADWTAVQVEVRIVRKAPGKPSLPSGRKARSRT